MYTISLERIPLPNLSTYVLFSIISFVSSVVYLLIDYVYDNYTAYYYISVTNSSSIKSYKGHSDFLRKLTEYCLYDTWCFWSFINLAYCGLILIGRGFQQVFFGELRQAEQSHILDKFWNFVFYKLVFIYGILNVQSLHELLLWTGWSSILGFLHLLTNLTKDRFEFIVQSPDTSVQSHLKIVSLLIIILIFGNALSCISIIVGVRNSYHLMFFMLAEVFQLSSITVYVLISYGIYFYTNDQESISTKSNKYKLKRFISDQKRSKWPNKMVVQYYAELYYAAIANVVDFIHNLHMLFWNNIKINMTGLVIGMHLQYLYYDLSKRYSRHKKYINIVMFIEANFPLLSKSDEKCAICWDSLYACRMLPCKHLFHDACLRPWLEHSSLCPTCRVTIKTNCAGISHISNYRHSGLRDGDHSENLDNIFLNNEDILSNGGQTSDLIKNHSDPFLNGSSLTGKVDIIHATYPNIPVDIIFQELKHNNGDMDSVIDKIQKGRISRPLPRLLTGPMQVELDLRQNEDYPHWQYQAGGSDPPRVRAPEGEAGLGSKAHRQRVLQRRKREIFRRGLEQYERTRARTAVVT